MIKSISIKNFQSHQDTKIEFSYGVNAIIGESDSGKTAILRALYWAINNKPSGVAFVSNLHPDDPAIAKIEFDNAEIERRKGKKENLYKILGVDFTAFGAGVPEEVEKLTGIRDINIQLQMDAPFLLSQSAGEISRYFNDIIGLEVIDSSLANANKRMFANVSEIKALQKRKTEIEQELEQLKWVESADKRLSAIETRSIRLSKKKKEMFALYALIDKIEDITEQIDSFPPIQAISQELELIKLQQQTISEQKKQVMDLSKLLNKIEYTKDTLSRVSKNLSENQKQYSELFPNVCPLCGQEVCHD